jgi:RNA polymerase sigma-70 factor (ECF subfamily)
MNKVKTLHASGKRTDHTILSDADLVACARASDRDAFGELIRRHHPACLRLAIYMLRNRAEAEEEVQNAYMRAYEHLCQFQGSAEFSSWLSRIVTNHCLMLLRVKARARMVHIDGDGGREGDGTMELPCSATDPERELIQTQMADVLQREIRRIPALLRNVVVLRDVEQLPMPTVARRLGITVPAAKSRLFRARVELRSRVLQFCGTNGYAVPRSVVQSMPAKSTRCPIAAA